MPRRCGAVRRSLAIVFERSGRRGGRIHSAGSKAGWDYLLTIVGDAKKDFSVRYAGLRTVRFFWENRPDVVPGKQVLAAMQTLMSQSDLADLPIEDLRKWKQWDQTAAVLKYGAVESYNSIPIVYRSIVKFALSAAQANPKNAAAVEFVAAALRARTRRRWSCWKA